MSISIRKNTKEGSIGLSLSDKGKVGYSIGKKIGKNTVRYSKSSRGSKTVSVATSQGIKISKKI